MKPDMEQPLQVKANLGLMAIKRLFHIPKNCTTPEGSLANRCSLQGSHPLLIIIFHTFSIPFH